MTLSLKKNLGNWGETQIDLYLAKHGFEPIVKNKFFRGGEIDRIYLSKAKHQCCIAEIKTISCSPKASLPFYFGTYCAHYLVKQRQLSNLRFTAETYQNLLPSHPDIYIRFFVIFVCHRNQLKITESCYQVFGGKILCHNNSFCIASFDPN